MTDQYYYPGAYSGLVGNYYTEVSQGRYWRRFELDGADLILTDAFQDLPPADKTDIFTRLNIYRNRKNVTPEAYGIGEHIGEGFEGVVLSFGETFVLKVMHGSRMLEDFDYTTRMLNMSALREHFQNHLPRWLGVVEDYLCLNDWKFIYCVKPRIGNGITVGDLHRYIKGYNLSQGRLEAIGNDFPGFNLNDWEVIDEQVGYFERWVEHLTERRDFGIPSILDFKGDNIIVTLLTENKDSYPYKLWLIDQ